MADITFGTNNEFGFDYLRDNMAAVSYTHLDVYKRQECEEGKSDYNDQQRAFTSDCL